MHQDDSVYPYNNIPGAFGSFRSTPQPNTVPVLQTSTASLPCRPPASGSMSYESQSWGGSSLPSLSNPFLPTPPSHDTTSIFAPVRDVFSTPSASDASSGYNSFFRSLRPPSPPKSAATYDDFFNSSRSTQLRPRPASMIDLYLGQPPPSGNSMFSMRSNTTSSLPSSSASLPVQAPTHAAPAFSPVTTTENFMTGDAMMDTTFETPTFETPASKRKERSSLPTDTPSPQGQTPKRQKAVLGVSGKLNQLFDLLKEFNWTLGEMMHHLFVHRDSEGEKIPRTQRHGNLVETYLSGRTTHTISEILDAWLTSPYGRGYSDQLLFETDTPYHSIRPVRQALTGFAAQSCCDFLESESNTAVAVLRRLWAETVGDDEEQSRELHDLGSAIKQSNTALAQRQRLAMAFMHRIAEPKPRSRDGVTVVRKSRPRENVVTNCLAILDFCKNDQARLLPLARGILYLSSNVPMEIIAHGSRLALMPSVKTIKAALKKFSQNKAVIIRTRGRDTTITRHADGRLTKRAKGLIFDNVQHFLRQRDLRIGRENSMIIGIFAFFFEFTVDAAALDPLDKRNRILTSRRPHITVDDLLALIDQDHIKNVAILQFIEALTNYVPHATAYKKDLYIRYRTRVGKLEIPLEPMEIHTLATSGKNETSITELRDGLLDFLKQMGLVEGDYDFELWFGGGDGLSYHNMLALQRYLQNHKDPFQSFELLRPVLQVWHTMWTDLCRIFETHWATPGNLKKVDYYPSAQLLSLVHDVRMLDCWAIHFNTTDIFGYFEERAKLGTLPSFEELETGAKLLFETYVSSGSRYQVQIDARDEATWSTARAPLGAPWQEPSPSTTRTPPKRKRKSAKVLKVGSTFEKSSTRKPSKKDEPKPPFFGDQVFFDEATFMYDALISREVAAAAAQGAVGRMWEALKVMVFTFGGSSHKKYMGYMLEMIVDVELESSPSLKDANLLSMVVSPDGEAGKCQPCDIYQEFLNRCLDPIVQRKDAEYGAEHVRETWARNIKDIYDLKKEFRANLGLKKRSGRHKKPHERPEVKTLLREYQSTQLHRRVPGRTFNDGRNVDNFQSGIQNLADGALKKWAKRTTNSRIRNILHGTPTASHAEQPPVDLENGSDWSDSEDSDSEAIVPMTPGDIYYQDGELIIDVGEDDDDEDILSGIISGWGENTEDEESDG
ncbi:hypothetical protein C8R43DRAFT_1140157 [Mycena crocata]|nr:hypothetical protein C8R43DRAFT_1140157 [Mycena crocata]